MAATAIRELNGTIASGLRHVVSSATLNNRHDRNSEDATVFLESEQSGRRDEQAVALCDSLIDITSALFGVSSKEMRRSGRTNLDVARVRQVAMYVAHVVLRLTMKEIGIGFSRDRTTVLHACHLVEDLRDDLEFDRIVCMMERVATAAFRNHLGEI